MAKKLVSKADRDLKDARVRKINWVQLADSIANRKRIAEERKEFPSREAFWNEIADETGYSRNALQRMESTLHRLRELERSDRKEITEILKVDAWEDGILLDFLDKHPKAETFARIHKLDPPKAWDLLRRMRIEKVSVTEMKDIIREIQNEDPRPKRLPGFGVRGEERESKFVAVEAHKEDIYSSDDVNFYFNRYRFPLVASDVVAIECSVGGIEFVDAFHYVPSIKRSIGGTFRNLLAETEYKTTFFRNVWLLIGDPDDFNQIGVDTSVDRLGGALDKLGTPRVGIIFYDEDKGLQIIRRPRGSDKPSRYQLVLNEVMRQGVPDFGAA